MATKRRRFAEFKARVAMEALRGERPIQAIAAEHAVHPNQVSGWKRQEEGLREVFAGGANRRQADQETVIHDLHAKIGELISAIAGSGAESNGGPEREREPERAVPAAGPEPLDVVHQPSGHSAETLRRGLYLPRSTAEMMLRAKG